MALLKSITGGAITFVVLLIFGSGYYYWTNHFNWYTDSFFINEFEKHTSIELGRDASVIWKWAAPRGSDWKPHYISAAILAPAFDQSMVDASFKLQTNCYELSGGAKRFLIEASSLQCWSRGISPNLSKWFLILHATEEDIVLFKMSTN